MLFVVSLEVLHARIDEGVCYVLDAETLEDSVVIIPDFVDEVAFHRLFASIGCAFIHVSSCILLPEGLGRLVEKLYP